MDRGAWWATVHRVAKSQTPLSIHEHTHTHTHTEEVPRVGLQLTFAHLHYTSGQKVNKGTHTS